MNLYMQKIVEKGLVFVLYSVAFGLAVYAFFAMLQLHHLLIQLQGILSLLH